MDTLQPNVGDVSVGCKCGKCPLGGKNYSIKEERELNLIEAGLQHKGDHYLRYLLSNPVLPCSIIASYVS